MAFLRRFVSKCFPNILRAKFLPNIPRYKASIPVAFLVLEWFETPGEHPLGIGAGLSRRFGVGAVWGLFCVDFCRKEYPP